jgi:hypothetical protein
MNLQEFFDYKNQLMGDLITTKKIVELMGDDVTLENANELPYRQIFPCEYVPDTTEKGYTYICMDVDVQSSTNKTFLIPVLYVWVFAHRSRLRLPEGGVRTDKLCSEICDVINGSAYYGLGKLTLSSTRRFAPTTDYQGRCMVFTAVDFNRQYDGKKPIPANRKSG